MFSFFPMEIMFSFHWIARVSFLATRIIWLTRANLIEKGFRPALYIKQRSSTNPVQTHANTTHTPKAGYKDAERSNTTPSTTRLTRDLSREHATAKR